jgi:hypothetical protein
VGALKDELIHQRKLFLRNSAQSFATVKETARRFVDNQITDTATT